MNEKKRYSYSYSADENNEIKRIREKYTEPNERETKLEQLRRLDASVHNKAAALSLSIGIIGALLLGFGMSCAMVWADKMFVAGIIFGIIGIVITALAYPIYKAKSEKLRKEIAPVILKLTDELIK
jgi:hypothetical protein